MGFTTIQWKREWENITHRYITAAKITMWHAMGLFFKVFFCLWYCDLFLLLGKIMKIWFVFVCWVSTIFGHAVWVRTDLQCRSILWGMKRRDFERAGSSASDATLKRETFNKRLLVRDSKSNSSLTDPFHVDEASFQRGTNFSCDKTKFGHFPNTDFFLIFLFHCMHWENLYFYLKNISLILIYKKIFHI